MLTKRIAVVLADAARARFFTIEEARGQGGRPSSALREHVDLVQSGRRARPAEALSDSRPGTQRGGGSEHAVDDHRGAKMDEGDRRFAGQVMDRLGTFCGEVDVNELLVVAPPRFLGHLRRRNSHVDGEVRFVGLEISALTGPEALQHLARHGHIEVTG